MFSQQLTDQRVDPQNPLGVLNPVEQSVSAHESSNQLCSPETEQGEPMKDGSDEGTHHLGVKLSFSIHPDIRHI